jgi:hypothetical protein
MKIPHVHITPYNKHANGAVERGHFILREAIVKTSEKDRNGQIKNWHQHVELAAFADRITVSSVTGYSPYYLLHGTQPLLPFDLSESTFMIDGYRSGLSTSELLSLRIRQLHRHPADLEKAAKTLKQARFRSKLQFEKRYHHKLQKDNYLPGSLVLVRNSRLEATVAKFKTEPRYLGPFEVVKRTTRGNYILQELDGAEHAEQYAAFRIIPYITRTDPQFHELLQASGDSDNDSANSDYDRNHDNDKNNPEMDLNDHFTQEQDPEFDSDT